MAKLSRRKVNTGNKNVHLLAFNMCQTVFSGCQAGHAPPISYNAREPKHGIITRHTCYEQGAAGVVVAESSVAELRRGKRRRAATSVGDNDMLAGYLFLRRARL